MIGAGAIGGYYGARLAEIGRNVHFLIGRDYKAVNEHGLTVTSPDGDFQGLRLEERFAEWFDPQLFLLGMAFVGINRVATILR